MLLSKLVTSMKHFPLYVYFIQEIKVSKGLSSGCPHDQGSHGSQMKVRESQGNSDFFIESQGKSVKFLTSTCFMFQECKIQHYKISPC